MGQGSKLAKSLLGLSFAAALITPLSDGSAIANVQAQPADWQATALTGSVFRVFLPTDGSVLAQTSDDRLLRSGDAGATFQPISLPQRTAAGSPRLLEVDPTNGSVLLVEGTDGLLRSSDGGVTYSLILSGEMAGLSVSPADTRILYVAAPGLTASRLRFFRSRDRGIAFEQLEELQSQNPNCVFGLGLLEADEMDPRRVFRSASCTAGRDLASPSFTRVLERSLDQGVSFTIVARPQGGSSNRLVGGSGRTQRYYLSDFKPFFANPASLHRSDDGGNSFAQVFQLPRVEGDFSSGAGPQTAIGGLAYDPTNPDRVFIGRRNRLGGVLTSRDAGRTFVPLGREDIGEVLDLRLSPDRLNLYAATTEGLFFLSLSRGLPDSPAPIPTVSPAPTGGSK